MSANQLYGKRSAVQSRLSFGPPLKRSRIAPPNPATVIAINATGVTTNTTKKVKQSAQKLMK